MTLYFESYLDEQDALLNGPLPVKEMSSIKKILHCSTKGWQREYIPAYVLQIDNETMLKQAFEAFFYVAEQNFLFALTNETSLFYKGYSLTTTSNTVEVLIADYDGQGAIFMTTNKEEIRCANI